ncbi:MAG: CopD family protein [bacterium]|nr:CopD family protein [bacterium]
MPLALFLLLAGLLFPQPAAAHGYLLRAMPEDRAVLERPPVRLQYWFSEDLERDFSTVHLRDQNGTILATGRVSDENQALMTLRVPPDLPNGAYIVELRTAFASDGHVVAESRVFFVGEEVGDVAGQAANARAHPLEIVWRTITLSSTMLLFGLFTLYAGVMVPAWGSPVHRSGWLPPRVMNRLNWLIGAALAAVFAGNALALVQQTMTFFNVDFAAALNPELWSVVRIGSRFGDAWNARMVFLLIVAGMFAASVVLRKANPATVRPVLTANAWVMALVIGTFSVTSHAAGSQVLPWVGIAVDWLHGVGVGFWVGGLAALVLVLPAALRPYTDDARRLALLAALRRFSRYAVASLVVVVASGIYSASNWIATPNDLTQTSFGGALLLKLLLVAGLVGLGALHHVALNPKRYARFAALIRPITGFIGTLRLEVVVALLVLISVGQLSATPVPVPEDAGQDITPPSATQALDDMQVSVTLSPGGPGVNTYDVVVTRENIPVEALNVRLRLVNPNADWRSIWLTAEAVGGGLYVAAGPEIDAPGQWWTLVDLGQGEAMQRLAFAWDIQAEAAITQTRAPSVSNLVALAVVIAALAWVVYPWAADFYRRLDLNPTNVTVAVGATAATVFLLALGFVILQQTQQRYQARLNPPPQVVNAVLPDQDSLQRGQTLFEEACTAWPNSRDFLALRRELPLLRDDALYMALDEGWRGLRGCDDLTDAQRWDVVNYLRTLDL